MVYFFSYYLYYCPSYCRYFGLPPTPSSPGHGFFPFRFSLYLPTPRLQRYVQSSLPSVSYRDLDRSRPRNARSCRLARRRSVLIALVNYRSRRRTAVDYFRFFLTQIYSDVTPAMCAFGDRWCGAALEVFIAHRPPLECFYTSAADVSLYAKTPLLSIAPRTRFTGLVASCRTKQNIILTQCIYCHDDWDDRDLADV